MNALAGARLLVTGGAGFIGSNFALRALATGAERVTVLDALTYAGNLDNLASVAEDPRFRFVRGDIADRALVATLLDVDVVFNFASESHMDRSLAAPAPFLDTNVIGTFHLLEALRARVDAGALVRMVHVSTDEVYGSIEVGVFTEESPSRPRSPYAASKSAAEGFVFAWANTWGVPAVVTRGSNTYGPRQFPEKLIPLFVDHALRGLPMPLYGDGLHVRDWLHVDDHCDGLACVATHGAIGSAYNLGGGEERTNRAVADAICAALPGARTVAVADRLGHDRRYALDASRAHALGWRPRYTFEDGLAETIEWYRSNPGWLERVRSGEYRR